MTSIAEGKERESGRTSQQQTQRFRTFAAPPARTAVCRSMFREVAVLTHRMLTLNLRTFDIYPLKLVQV